MLKYKKIIFGTIGIIVLILFCYYFSNIVAWLLIAGFISMLGSPIIKLLDKIKIKKFHIPRWISAMITTAFIWSVFVSFFYLTIPFIGTQISVFQSIDIESLQEGLQEPIQKIDENIRRIAFINLKDFSLEKTILEKISEIINFSVISNFINEIGLKTINLLLSLFSITFFSYFFLKDSKLFDKGVMTIIPTKLEEKAQHVLNKLPSLIKRYIYGIFLEILAITTLITIGLLICKLNFGLALMIGMICGFLNVIPYIGPWIGAAIGIIFIGAANINADFYVATMPKIWGLLIVVVIVRLIDDFVFQPVIYSRSVKAHPLEIFIVIIIAGQLYGIIGMILAIPAYTVLRVIAKEFLNEYKFVRQITKNIDVNEVNNTENENKNESI